MKTVPFSLMLLTLTTALGSVALAESSDSNQPIQILADRFDGDQVRQTAVYSGNVVVQQGTLEMRGGRLELSIDPQGYRHGVLTPESGKLVSFKQKRDSKSPKIEEWMHGAGRKLAYNEKNNSLVLTNDAVVSRRENGVLKDESRGNLITYNMTTSTAVMTGDASKGKAGRVRTVIAPRTSESAATRTSITLEPNRQMAPK